MKECPPTMKKYASYLEIWLSFSYFISSYKRFADWLILTRQVK
jgi:hypothetical protein